MVNGLVSWFGTSALWMGWWMDQCPVLELEGRSIELIIIGQDECAGRWETIEIDK